MRAQLRREALVRALPALHGARAEQLRHPGDVAVAVVELLLHLAAVRPEHARVGALLQALARELRDWNAARLHARIAAQQSERVLAPLGGVASVEEILQCLAELA